MTKKEQGFRALELYNQLTGEGMNEEQITSLCEQLIDVVKDVGTEND